MENVADRSQYKLDKPLAGLSDDLAGHFPVDKPALPVAVDEEGQERLLISDEGQITLGSGEI